MATKINGEWKTISSQEYVEMAEHFSLGLMELGVSAGDKIGLITHNNRYEWNVSDIGILQLGAVDVPVYPTISDEDTAYIFNDAEVTLCFVSNDELYQKVMRIKDQIPSLKAVYTFLPVDDAPNWEEVLESGRKSDRSAELQKAMDSVNEEDLATLIYTSGTTGKPKGVMLSHKNIATNATDCQDRFPVSSGSWALSFLPVCHIFERMLSYLYSWQGIPIYFGQSLETVGDDIREVQPHIFTAVPRLLEKVFDKIMAKGSDLTGVKKSLFFWAVGLAEEFELSGKSFGYNLQLALARKLIFSKWHEALGGNVRAIASGSAALNPKLTRIFLAAGINIQEGYGLTETSPVISVNGRPLEDKLIGGVGRPIENVMVRIAEDGEITVKGPNVMMGYYKQPELTAEVLSSQGWFKTGDIGEINDQGHLRITDRKKEIFKTSGGKYVAPQIMENTFKESRFIEQIMVIGESEKHPAALVQPEWEFVKDWCAKNGVEFGSTDQVVKDQRLIDRISEEIEKANQSFSQWEQVKKFELTPESWTIDAGHLTPTLKLKRKNITKSYADLYERIYGHPPIR
jgi:long-chain acyl-CoA synthetase